MKRVNIPKNVPPVRKKNLTLAHNHFPRIRDGLASGKRSFEGLAADITHLEGLWDAVEDARGNERAGAIKSARAKQGSLAREMQTLFGHLMEGAPAKPKDQKNFRDRATSVRDDLRSGLMRAGQVEADLIEKPYGAKEKTEDKRAGRGREGFFPGAFINKGHLKEAIKTVSDSSKSPTDNIGFEKAIIAELKRMPLYANERIPPRLLQDHARHHQVEIQYPNKKNEPKEVLELGTASTGGMISRHKYPGGKSSRSDSKTAASARYNG